MSDSRSVRVAGVIGRKPKRLFVRAYLPATYRQANRLVVTRETLAFYLCVGALLLAVPQLAPAAIVDLATLIAFATIGALALNLLTGVAGQISIGNAAFLAIGGMASGLTYYHFPTASVAAPIAFGVVSAAVIGLLVGLPALRVRNIYLVVSTLALHFIVVYFATRLQSSTVGESPFFIPSPNLAGWTIDTATEWYYVSLGLAGLALLFVVSLIRSTVGRSWSAVRDRDIAAEMIGVNVKSETLTVFVVSSVLISFQGVVLAHYLGVAIGDSYSLNVAIQYIAMIIIGGLGSPLGSIVGAAFVMSIPYLLENVVGELTDLAPSTASDLEGVLYGAAIVAFVLFEPGGIAEIWRRARQYLALWPLSRTPMESGE